MSIDHQRETMERRLRGLGVHSGSRIMFHSKSKAEYPMRGAQEQWDNTTCTADMDSLRSNPHFRRRLSNFSDDTTMMTIDDTLVVFACVEACWQYMKFQVNGYGDDPAVQPLLDRGITGLEARKLRKARILSPDEIKVWTRLQPHFIGEMLLQKFLSHRKAHEVLLATGNVHLIHTTGRGCGTHGVAARRQPGRLIDLSQWELMGVRNLLLARQRMFRELQDKKYSPLVIPSPPAKRARTVIG